MILLNGLITNDRSASGNCVTCAGLARLLAKPEVLVRTFAMSHSIGEMLMKRQWRVRRQFQSTTDAERRWDQAYQHLLGWTLLREPVSALLPPFHPPT